MPFFDPIRIGASGAAATAYSVDRSLRFNSADDAYLTRTPSSTGNQKVWTWSAWFKRTNLGGDHKLFASNETNSSGHGLAALYFASNDKLNTYYDTPSGQPYGAVNDRVYRDVSAWYHIVWQVDAANTTQRIWINGVEETLSSSYNPIDYNYTMNQSGYTNVMGANPWNTSNTSDMYLAEVHFSDGNKYAASDFGETDATTGQWVPKSVSITYGTNGFYLNFSDNSGTTATTLGKDSSGNGNNFTPNNFAVSDAVKDSPTNNFCTLNPLQKNPNGVYSEGNLRLEPGSGYNTTIGNMGVSSGKWYFEARCNGIAGGAGQERWIFGIHETTGQDFSDATWWYSGSYTISNYGYVYGVQDGDKKVTNETQSSFTSGLAVGNVVGFKLNLDDNELSISVDGVDKGKMFDIQGGKTYAPAGNFNQSGTSVTLNCGQDSTFHGQESSGGNTDSGGIGDFAYAVPSGYQALCTANLPDPTILLPNKHFGSIKYTGDGTSSHSITNSATVDFTPDWVWIKRNAAEGHGVFDSMRGVTKRLRTDTNNKETTISGVTAFINNGFTLGATFNINSSDYVSWNWNAGDADSKTFKVVVVTDSGNKYRFRNSADSATFAQSAVTLDLEEGGTYVFDWSDSTAQSHPIRFSTTSDGTHGGGSEYTTGVVKDDSAYKTTITVAASAPQLYYYCQNHSGMGGAINTNATTGSTNFDGSTLSKVKKNLTAGFSIVRYVGTGSAETIGHGLGIAPKVVITKDQTFENNNGVGYSWVVATTAIDGSYDILYLNLNYAKTDSSLSAPTSTVFSINNSVTYSRSGEGKINYCFNEVEGFSKFGSYVGNGSTDGTFVYTGFRPAYLIMKSSSHSTGSGYWSVYDNQRDLDNVLRNVQYPNENIADGVADVLDFTANGFKLRNTSTQRNGSSRTYFYYAFAESPFKNARAR